MFIREVEKPKFRDIFYPFNFGVRQKYHLGNNEINIVGSGKGALALVLRYLKKKEIIFNKLDEILVADWIGYWVYNQIQPFAFPVKKLSEKTKAILVYHQYGFPQKMDKILDFAHDKKILVIEDCAHCLESYYEEKLAGTFGDFTIYSFSKWFFCFALGGVVSKFPDFNQFIKEEISKAPFTLTLFKDVVKLADERALFCRSARIRKASNYFLNMSYSLYGEALKSLWIARQLMFTKIDKELKIRQQRYQYFLKQMQKFGVCEHLEKEKITPYVIPIYLKNEQRRKELVRTLGKNEIVTGIYNFDINRNLFFPEFIPVILIPCHGGISDNIFDKIIEIILKSL